MNEEIERTIARVASLMGVTVEEIAGRDKRQGAVRARFVAWHMLHEKYGLTQRQISEMFDRDHSSVSHGLNRASVWLRTDAEVKEVIAEAMSEHWPDSLVGIRRRVEAELEHAKSLTASLESLLVNIEREMAGHYRVIVRNAS